MVTCPYCSYQLLRHVRHGEIYWFCSHCWQEVPNLESVSSFLNRVIDTTKPRTDSKPEASIGS